MSFFSNKYDIIFANKMTKLDIDILDKCCHSILRYNKILTMAQRVKGFFTCNINHNQQGWQYRSNDFIKYENYYKRKVIAFTSKEQIYEVNEYCGKNNFNDNYLRPHEPKILVHSTTKEAWKDICKNGKLYSFYKLSHNYDPNIGLGYYFLNEPEDYAHYVMLSEMDNPVGELVVASRVHGKLIYDINVDTVPGVRLYIDATNLANDGILIRDGIQYKVRNSIDLDKYLVSYITVQDIDDKNANWTVNKFMCHANNYFLLNYKAI